MDWKSQFKVHDLSFRNIGIVFLLLAVNLLILIQTSFWQVNPEAVFRAYSANCASQQKAIYASLCELPDGDGFELPPDWTVADLIREAYRKDRQAISPLEEEFFSCRNIRYVRAFPYLRRERTEVDAPYLVFPALASVVFDDSLQQPVPILMCPPGAHGDKRGSMVLYSDGTVKSLTTEEAKKLVAEQSPVPLKIKRPDSRSKQEAKP